MKLSMEQSKFHFNQTMEMTIKKVVIKIDDIAVFVWGPLPKSEYRTIIRIQYKANSTIRVFHFEKIFYNSCADSRRGQVKNETQIRNDCRNIISHVCCQRFPKWLCNESNCEPKSTTIVCGYLFECFASGLHFDCLLQNKTHLALIYSSKFLREFIPIAWTRMMFARMKLTMNWFTGVKNEK